MKKVFCSSILIFIFLLFIVSDVQAQLESFGLPGKQINAIALFPHDISSWQYYLCAGSDSNGVFLRELSSPDSLWMNRGLAGKKVTSLHVYHWGVGPADINSIFAGVRPDKPAGDSTLIYEGSYLGNWTAADSGLNANVIDQINAIGGFFFAGHTPPEPIFTANGSGINRAIGFPPNFIWQKIWPVSGFVHVNVIQIHRIGFLGSEGTVWAGGETGFFAPFLTKSEDKGDHWTDFFPSVGGDNACLSIAVSQSHPDTVYAGMEGMVIKTTDGGQNWIITALQNTPYYFYGIVVNPTNPNHVIAGGSSSTNVFGLFETINGGNSWIEIQPAGPLAGIASMVADTSNGEFVIYMGTFGDGVYRYKTPLVGIDDNLDKMIPEGLELYQNYPNPFNPTTTIKYDLKQTVDVKLKIYNMLGQEVRTLVNTRQEAGYKNVVWDGLNNRGSRVASGIYIYRIKAGDFVQARNMILLR